MSRHLNSTYKISFILGVVVLQFCSRLGVGTIDTLPFVSITFAPIRLLSNK